MKKFRVTRATSFDNWRRRRRRAFGAVSVSVASRTQYSRHDPLCRAAGPAHPPRARAPPLDCLDQGTAPSSAVDIICSAATAAATCTVENVERIRRNDHRPTDRRVLRYDAVEFAVDYGTRRLPLRYPWMRVEINDELWTRKKRTGVKKSVRRPRGLNIIIIIIMTSCSGCRQSDVVILVIIVVVDHVFLPTTFSPSHSSRSSSGAITSKIIHTIKLKTSPARLAQLLQPSLAFCFSLQPLTAQLCKSCRTCSSFIACIILGPTCDRSFSRHVSE